MSSPKEVLVREVEDAPDSLVVEVLDYLRYLRSRRVTEGMETAILSESALAKDWLRPEEDEAWKDL